MNSGDSFSVVPPFPLPTLNSADYEAVLKKKSRIRNKEANFFPNTSHATYWSPDVYGFSFLLPTPCSDNPSDVLHLSWTWTQNVTAKKARKKERIMSWYYIPLATFVFSHFIVTFSFFLSFRLFKDESKCLFTYKNYIEKIYKCIFMKCFKPSKCLSFGNALVCNGWRQCVHLSGQSNC